MYITIEHICKGEPHWLPSFVLFDFPAIPLPCRRRTRPYTIFFRVHDELLLLFRMEKPD